jgi:hypothetical protein
MAFCVRGVLQRSFLFSAHGTHQRHVLHQHMYSSSNSYFGLYVPQFSSSSCIISFQVLSTDSRVIDTHWEFFLPFFFFCGTIGPFGGVGHQWFVA